MAKTGPEPDSQLVDIYTPGDLLEAEAIREALAGVGIRCEIEGAESTGALFDGVEPLSRMRILVRAEDADQAGKIIDDGDWPRYS